MLDAAVRFFGEQNDILFMAHVSPDGDTLGSCLALYQMALQMGKRAQIVCEETVPAIYRFLPCAEAVALPENAQRAEAAMCVDCADLARTGAAELLFHAASATFNIDHHGTNGGYADNNFVQRSAATGELVYALLQALHLKLTPDIASCLFAAIATDTGNFSYSNTTADTFRITAALMDAGIDLPELNRQLFRTIPYRKTKLLGLAITKIELFSGGRGGIGFLTQDELKSCGASGEDAEGIIDTIRDIDSVEIAALLRESTDGRIRVSLRGKSAVNVNGIAVSFGGGGHRFAAGCTLDMPMAEAVRRIRAAVEAALSGGAD